MHRVLFGVILVFCVLLSACSSEEAPPPAVEAAPSAVAQTVIYELFVRDFTPEGTFRAIIPRLDELRALGVNTLWLMPIHPVGEVQRKGTLGSPYAVRDFYDVNPLFGTKDDFRALVDAVHDRDMRLIIDLVANHTAWDNAWMTEHPDWYTRDSTGQAVSPVPDWSDVADLNYDNPEVPAAMQDVMRYWVEDFGVDGFRCDVAEMVPMTFWQDAIAAVRAVKPVLMLAEGESPELYDVGFDLTYGWRYYHTLKDVWRGASVQRLAEVLREDAAALPEDAYRLRFTTNHDETAWDASPVDLFDGLAGARAAAVLAFTAPGVPLVYNGQEVGSDAELPLFEKMDIAWDGAPEMRAFYRELLALRAAHPALRHGALALPADTSATDVFTFERRADGERLRVAVNVRAAEAPLPEADAAGWELVWGAAPDGVLPGYGYAVWRRAE